MCSEEILGYEMSVPVHTRTVPVVGKGGVFSTGIFLVKISG